MTTRMSEVDQIDRKMHQDHQLKCKRFTVQHYTDGILFRV